MYDLPIMDTPAMAAETLRRIQHLLNMRTAPDNQRSYNTPYDDFTHQHMAGFNSVVVDALAVPAGATITNLKREGLLPMNWKDHPVAFQDEKTVALQIQWPFHLGNMRIIDNDNVISGFDLTELNADNPQVNNPHVDLLLPFQGSDDVHSKYWNDIGDIDGFTVTKMIHEQFGDCKTLHGASKEQGIDNLDFSEFSDELKWRLAAGLPADRKVSAQALAKNKILIQNVQYAAGTVGDLLKAQANHRKIRSPGPRRGRFTTHRPRVFQAWPTHQGRNMRESGRAASAGMNRKRNRMSTSLISGVGAKKSRAFEKILRLAENNNLPASADNTLNDSKTIDLTQDESMLDTTAMSEITTETPSALDDLPTEASFSKYLEERPNTGKFKMGKMARRPQK